MATRQAFRYVPRRFSSGKILSEEEKATENNFIKKMEQERLATLRLTLERQMSANVGGSGSASEATSSTGGVSTDKYRNYTVVAGVVTGLGALGWYYRYRPLVKL